MPICSSEICLCVSAYGGRGLIRGRRDDDCYERSAFFTALDLQGAAAHQMRPDLVHHGLDNSFSE